MNLNYIKMKDLVFFAVTEDVLRGLRTGVVFYCNSGNKQYDLYVTVFKDEKGRMRSLWCPAPIIKRKNPSLWEEIKNSVIFEIARSWHEHPIKIEKMVEYGRLYYKPQDFERFLKSKSKSA